MRNEIERREFLASLIVIPFGATVTGCGEDKIEPPPTDASCDGIEAVSTESEDRHTHTICVRQAILDKPPDESVTITTERVGSGAHTHTITLTREQIVTLADETGLVKVTTSTVYGHTHEFTLGVAGGSADMG